MNTRKMQLAGLVLAMGLSGAAHAALQGRDLNGSTDSFEAYYDTVLNITWLADGNYAKTSGYDADGKMNWAAANTWAANLSLYNPLTNQTYADWRLPTVEPINGTSFNDSYVFNGSTDYGYNISEQGTAFAGATGSEMAHLFYNTLDNKGLCDPATSTASSCIYQPGYGLANTGPFTSLQVEDIYWSATQYGTSPSRAWLFVMSEGAQVESFKTETYYALAVSPGDVAAVPEPEAWGLLLSGLALVGWAARRRNTR